MDELYCRSILAIVDLAIAMTVLMYTRKETAVIRSTRCLVLALGLNCLLGSGSLTLLEAADGKWPSVAKVEQQPLVAATERLVQALDYIGSPLGAEERKALEGFLKQ